MEKIQIDEQGRLIGLTESKIDSLIVALRAQSQGYNYMKNQSFSEQKRLFYQLQPELSKLSNSEFRKVVEAQLQQGKDCEDILIELEIWKKEKQK